MTLTGQILRRTGTTTVLAVPLVAAGRLAGVLTTIHPDRPRFTHEETAAIRAAADIFAASLETARTHERDRMQFESLHLATLAISEPMALPSVLQNIVDHARTLVGASFAALGFIDREDPDGPFNPWVWSGVSEHEAARIGRLPRPVGLLGAVVGEGRSVRLRNLVEDVRFQGFPANHPTMKSFLGVPVFYLDRAVGNLYLTNKCGADEFSEADQRLVEMLARHAGLAVEHARARAVLLEEIVQHRRDLDALRESEGRFRRLAENAPDVISRHRLGLPLAVDYVSPAVHAMLGHRPEEYYRDPPLFWQQIHPLDRPLMNAALGALDTFSGPLTLRWIHRSGRVVWAETRLVPIRDEAGKVTAVEGITRDVTGRKQAEGEIDRLLHRLSVSRSWLQTVIESSPVGIILVEDLMGKRITANREAEHLFGRPLLPEGGVEQFHHQIFDEHGAEIGRSERLVTRALQGETVIGQERLCRRPDGEDVPVLVAAAPVRDQHAGISGTVVIYKDISALKELERLRSEWTSIIAHDLRQPVQVIAVQANLLGREVSDPAPKPRIDRIRSATEQLSRMIADLLDVSRLDVRELPLSPETVDVVALAREVVGRMEEELAGHPVAVEAKTEVPKVQADPLRLGEVLGNLLSNAAKYSFPSTPIEVAIEATPGEVIVSVANQGNGIAPEETSKLFERFSRTGGAVTGRVRGVGLGLYIVKGLVEAHLGRVWVESVPCETTTFRFALPIEGAGAARVAA